MVLGTSQLFPVLIFVALFIAEPEMRVFITGGLLALLGFIAALIILVTRADRVGEAARQASPGAVVFGAYNYPGALVHVGDYMAPGAEIARGLTLIVVADEDGIRYLTPGKSPRTFVRVPWSDVDHVAEVGGELAVRLASGDVQYIVPGARVPMSKRRVRAIAAQLSALQPQRQL
ncbi:hypothetical protein [Conyzicola nivalis]|uniref:hypothetical protein n=1 Tax=Conyzicola nivalis TaxID=1477021 RepID=UPI00166B1EF3|nr:hypothetical protein [Conyzicola nivalis]